MYVLYTYNLQVSVSLYPKLSSNKFLNYLGILKNCEILVYELLCARSTLSNKMLITSPPVTCSNTNLIIFFLNMDMYIFIYTNHE